MGRRRRFFIILIIASLTFFLFGWYMRSDSKDNSKTRHVPTEENVIIKNDNLDAEDDLNSKDYFGFLEKKLDDQFLKSVEEEKLTEQKYFLEVHEQPGVELFNADVKPAENQEQPAEKVNLEVMEPIPDETDYAEESYMIPQQEEQRNVIEATIKIQEATTWVKNPGLILDTNGCKIPKFDPFDPTVKEFIYLQDQYECPGPPLFMRPQPDGSIYLNETVLERYYHTTRRNLTCHYRDIHRLPEHPGGHYEQNWDYGKKLPLEFGHPLNEDYVVAYCDLNNVKDSFEQYFPLVRLKRKVEEERSKLHPPEPRLNIILAGIDSVSKLNFLRHFPRTQKFLKEMGAFEMNGYNKVGDNTFPNLTPMLTGHFIDEIWNETVRHTFTFDSVDLMWKEYAKKGYRTFYAEDAPHSGTFNYLKRGFLNPPTDYYMRPIQLAVEYSDLRKTSKAHCLNSQIETDLIYDYLRDFITAMDTRPYFAFAMVSTITHDYLNQAGWADDPTVRLLEDLTKSGALESSMFVLFSDHGLRFGKLRETYIGKFEERMPFMYIHFPQWFLTKYPHFERNLRQNQERLMTLFDIHATMVHLLDLEEKTAYNNPHGVSLLKELSSDRTCEEANIQVHWCSCQNFDQVPLDDPATIQAAQSLVNDINDKLLQFEGRCEVLQIDHIMDARFGQANDVVMRYSWHENEVINSTVILGDKVSTFGDYSLTLTTKPGKAVFEGTVRYNRNDNSYTVLGISRINMYKNQSWCIDSQKMKIYCYCKEQLPEQK